MRRNSLNAVEPPQSNWHGTNGFQNNGGDFSAHGTELSDGKNGSKKNGHHSSSPKEDLKRLKAFLCTGQGLCVIVVGIALMLLLPKLGKMVISIFRWAEERVDSTSWLHMLGFLLVSLLFHFPAPVPVVMQAWAIAVGCFFKWRGFVLLVLSFSLGVPMSFLIGRYAAQAGEGAIERQMRAVIPTGMEYIRSLARAVSRTPVKLSFLLMWAPLPTSMCPFMVGFIVPARELPLQQFLSGAIPSKLLHFSCSVLIGVQAGSFASAMSMHDGGGGNSSEAAGGGWGHALAVGSMVLSVVLMCAMMFYIHGELVGVQAWTENEDREDDRMFVKVL